MAIIRVIPRKGKRPAYRGRVMIDAVRGVLRVRKWPKKRGTPRSASQRWWIDWFTQANLLAKYADPMSQARAIEMAQGSGMYPRDVLLKAMRGRLYFWSDTTGWKWYSVAAQQDVSNSLDALAQVVGSVLVRAVDRWRAPPAGIVGDLLTYKGSATPPIWQAPGGGVVQEELAGSPIVVDGSVAFYDIDVSAYLDVVVSLEDIVISAAQGLQLLFSIDGGTIYKNGGTDYWRTSLNSIAEAGSQGSALFFHATTGTGIHSAQCKLGLLRAPRPSYTLDAARSGSSVVRRGGYPTFDGPITNIKIRTSGGATFDTGTIRIVGSKGA